MAAFVRRVSKVCKISVHGSLLAVLLKDALRYSKKNDNSRRTELKQRIREVILNNLRRYIQTNKLHLFQS